MLSSNNQSKKLETSRWNGTLSRAEFQIAASAFADQWNKFNSGLLQCSWVPCPNPPWLPPSSQVEGYLSVERVILPSTAEEFSREGNGELREEELSCSDNESFIDNVTLAQNLGLERHYYDFHVVYSVSYRVPVLYFHACHSDGQPLALDDIEKDIPANHGKVLMESKWSFITQEDHPYLNRPWYTLHACGTSEWMKILFRSEHSEAQAGVGIAKYMVSWFSVVGQVFGLKIPFEMLGSSGGS